MKRTIGFVLAALLCVSLLPVVSWASETPSDDFEVSDGVLIKYTGTEADVKIPPDLGITEIGEHAFESNRSKIRSVTVPDGVVKIGVNAFGQCTNMTEVQLPDTLQIISGQAFDTCNALFKINLPPNLLSIGNSAFRDCYMLETIVIPASVQFIEMNAFSHAGLDSSSFAINFAERTADPPLILAESAFQSCYMQALHLPDGLITIPPYMCSGCRNLSVVSIPSTVTDIGSDAFLGCRGLKTVHISAVAPTSIDPDVFQTCTSLQRIEYDGTPAQWAGSEWVKTLANLNPFPTVIFTPIRQDGITYEFVKNAEGDYDTVGLAGCSDGAASLTIPEAVSIGDEKYPVSSVDPAVLPSSLIRINYGGTAEEWADITDQGEIAKRGILVEYADGSIYPEIVISLPQTLEMKAEGEGTLTAAVTGTGEYSSVEYKGAQLAWTSSNTEVAAVKPSTNGSGTLSAAVTALKGGDAVITASSGSASAFCTVQVSSLVIPSTMELYESETKTITADVFPAGASVAWTSNDRNVVAVTGQGNTATVTGVAAGTAEITAAMTSSAGNITKTCKVVVRERTIKLDKSELELTLGTSAEGTITAAVIPPEMPVTWKSSDEKVAAVFLNDNGNRTEATVEARSAGSATITAQAGTATATCTVTVTDPAARPTTAPPTVTTPPPTETPSDKPEEPSDDPTDEPTHEPSGEPSGEPTAVPTERPTHTAQPSGGPTRPTDGGTGSATPSVRPTSRPTGRPTYTPGASASSGTSSAPSPSASSSSTAGSSDVPSSRPTQEVSPVPSALPEATSAIAGGTISVTNPDSGYEFEVTDSYTAIEGTIGAYDEAECTDVAQILSELTVPEGTLVVCRDADGSRIADTAMACTGQTIIFLDADSGREIASIVVVVKGDVTGDGVVNIVDIVFTAQAVNGERSLEGPSFLAADMTDNGTIDIADVVQMARIITGA